MKTKQMKNQEGEKEKQMRQSNMNERKVKEGKMKILREHGITLVALVVTIIIMLILAGIVLRMAIGENGLFEMSKKSTNKYKEAEANESREMGKAGNEISNIIESLTPPAPIDASEMATSPKKYYGQYVNYGVDLNGDEDYTNDWRLFYVGGSDENDSDDVKGRIYLIAADYVPMENSTLKGAMGNGTSKAMMKPATSSGYETLSANWPSAPAYQELTGLKTDPTKLFMHEGYDLSRNKTVENSRCVSILLNTDNWSGFVNKEYYGEVAIGGPTVEMWCKAWNAVVDEEDGFRKIFPNGNGTSGYYVGVDATQTSTYGYYITSSGSAFNTTEKDTIAKNYNVFFPHTENTSVTANGATGNCYGYWLASPSAGTTTNVMLVNYNGGVNYGNYSYTNGYGLRPVVCLQSGVKLQKNTAKSDDTKTVYDIVK